MMGSFEGLEQREVKKDVARVEEALEQRVGDLHATAKAWSNWDESYQFMQDRNPAFIHANFDLVNLKVDTILFVDSNRKLFHSKQINRSKDLDSPAPAQILRSLNLVDHTEDLPSAKSAFCGLILSNGHPLAVSVRPILPSSGAGAQRGWLIFAAFIDSADIASISKRSHLGVKLFPLDDKKSLPYHVAKAIPFLKSANDVIARPFDSDRIYGYAYLKDIDRKPIQLVQTSEAREIYVQGQDETQFLVRIIAFAGTAFSLVVLLAIERGIVARLALLANQVDIIRSESDLSRRVDSQGEDEITDLSDKINEMLGGLEVSTNKLRQSEDALRQYSENLESTVLQRTQEIEHLAYHDKLTGLPNRALLLDRIDMALKKDFRNHHGTAVMFVDLDNFKLVNDSLGHSFGDTLLIEITRILSDAVRPGDTVARIGGDEFTILFEELESVEVAEDVAKRILATLRQPILLGNRETFAGASIGLVYNQGTEIDAGTLVKHADTAMYRAKAAGKSNYVLYDESMHDHAIDRLELETSLRKALDNGEIYVEYQPLIDLTTNKMIGAEALGRWRHPDRGVISPEMFIPIAEETGLIVSIGYWILEQSCIQAKKWGIGRDIQSFVISVNLSGKQLQRDDVVDRIKHVLAKTGLPASQLKLEITETVLMEDREDIIEKMFQLKELGLQLALDDFGTGYSSLSTLRTFPIDTLKIDRAFICRLGMEESALPIVEAILGLARTMQMTVIGEGVENQTQQDIIRALGCQVGQGYFYDKPLSPRELGKRLRQMPEPNQMAA